MARLFFTLAFLVAVGLVQLRGAGAQEASPAASETVACTAEPRSVDDMLAAWFDPDGSPVAQAPVAEQVSEANPPQGMPADEATVAAIRQTALELDICFANGQFARAFALMTDDLLAQFGPDPTNPDEDTVEEVRAFLEAQESATPVAGEPTGIEGPRDARVLPDGRVGGFFTDPEETIYLVFEQVDGRWLIDEFISVAPGGTVAVASPAA